MIQGKGERHFFNTEKDAFFPLWLFWLEYGNTIAVFPKIWQRKPAYPNVNDQGRVISRKPSKQKWPHKWRIIPLFIPLDLCTLVKRIPTCASIVWWLQQEVMICMHGISIIDLKAHRPMMTWWRAAPLVLLWWFLPLPQIHCFPSLWCQQPQLSLSSYYTKTSIWFIYATNLPSPARRESLCALHVKQRLQKARGKAW